MATVAVAANPLLELQKYGQSVWLDNLRRGWLVSGELRRMIVEDGLRGMTVNPTIFERAISGTADYDDAVLKLVGQGKNTEEIYYELLIQDIRMAADMFRPVYDETNAVDGVVSIELPPALAHDTEVSIEQARRFRELVGRENIMVKVPGTREGVPTVEQLTYDGINVNITLLFSIHDYEQVAHAYIRGLQRRAQAGKLLDSVGSVASFFVSRIDTAVDRQLEQMISKAQSPDQREELESLLGRAAIANAKSAYQRFRQIFAEPGFKRLEEQGARVQRVLWASTSTKSPRYPDVYYIENLIGPNTVNTMPTATLFAFKDHGQVRPTLEENPNEAENVLERLRRVSIDFDKITSDLQVEGVRSFAKSVDELMECISNKRDAILRGAAARQTAALGRYQMRVDRALQALTEQAFTRRLWEKDPSLWRQGPAAETAIKNRLGWLDVVDAMLDRSDEITSFADEVKDAGFAHVVLLGMGGSSLSPEVSQMTFGSEEGRPTLMVLDSTVPAAVLDVESQIDLPKTLFVVSSKSGTSVETWSTYRYFFDRMRTQKGDRAPENFVAITDPGTSLESETKEKAFHRVFTNFPDIGGRYSALSYFGLVPAALIGADIRSILTRASRMLEACAPCVSTKQNPGVVLGTILAELAMEGRDKLTLALSPEIQSFGYWIEQLVAESSGKNGTALVPVESELIGKPNVYGDDRLFVHIRLETPAQKDLDDKMAALEQAGHPVVRIRLDDVYDLGQEYFRWEVATAAACALLGVNAFDEPNVNESRDNTNRLLEQPSKEESIQELPVENGPVKLFCDQETKAMLNEIRAAGPFAEQSVSAYLHAHLSQFQPGNYVALLAFVKRAPKVDGIFQCMRGHIRDAYKAATTLGYGPRFLHSTGQLHKGGPNTGLFIQFTAEDAEDVPIPGQPYTFSVLKQAQAMGDFLSLRGKGRRLLRVHLGTDVEAGLNCVLESVSRAAIEHSRRK